jgi:hypothetical protein
VWALDIISFSTFALAELVFRFLRTAIGIGIDGDEFVLNAEHPETVLVTVGSNCNVDINNEYRF